MRMRKKCIRKCYLATDTPPDQTPIPEETTTPAPEPTEPASTSGPVSPTTEPVQEDIVVQDEVTYNVDQDAKTVSVGNMQNAKSLPMYSYLQN